MVDRMGAAIRDAGDQHIGIHHHKIAHHLAVTDNGPGLIEPLHAEACRFQGDIRQVGVVFDPDGVMLAGNKRN